MGREGKRERSLPCHEERVKMTRGGVGESGEKACQAAERARMRAALSSTQGINREELGFGPSSGVGPDTVRERSSFVGLVPVRTRPPKPRSNGVSGHLRVSSLAGLGSSLPGWPAADACDVGSAAAARSGKRFAAATGYELRTGPRSREESAALGQHPRLLFSDP
ncbi:hypothetical protein MRX96_007452 [Rhipicephalus microplus]